jgi:hypothetical protein
MPIHMHIWTLKTSYLKKESMYNIIIHTLDVNNKKEEEYP